MSRITDLEEVIFPVEERPIFYDRPTLGDKKIINYKAIVNMDTGNLISVVSSNYRLVTNHEALELGKQCFKQLFRTVNTDDMEIFNIIVPMTRSFCHIDLIHKKYTVNIWKNEVWLPYIRITNSYNRTRALHFDLGFCRKLCDNGVIFEKESIKYKFYHTKNQIAPTGHFFVEVDKLKKMETAFHKYANRLHDYFIPEIYVFPFVCKIFNLTFDLESDNKKKSEKEQNRLKDFKDHIYKLIGRYYSEFGKNGYAVLNVISDFASRPSIYSSPKLIIDSFQKRVSFWIEDFSQQIERNDFTFEDYLGEYIVYSRN